MFERERRVVTTNVGVRFRVTGQKGWEPLLYTQVCTFCVELHTKKSKLLLLHAARKMKEFININKWRHGICWSVFFDAETQGHFLKVRSMGVSMGRLGDLSPYFLKCCVPLTFFGGGADIKIIATGCQILRLNSQNSISAVKRGVAPDPARGAYSAPPVHSWI